MEDMTEVACWADELESVFARVSGRFARADLRWRMRGYVRGPLGRAARKNGWQLAEWAGHRTRYGFQRLLHSSKTRTPCVTMPVIMWSNGSDRVVC